MTTTRELGALLAAQLDAMGLVHAQGRVMPPRTDGRAWCYWSAMVDLPRSTSLGAERGYHLVEFSLVVCATNVEQLVDVAGRLLDRLDGLRLEPENPAASIARATLGPVLADSSGTPTLYSRTLTLSHHTNRKRS